MIDVSPASSAEPVRKVRVPELVGVPADRVDGALQHRAEPCSGRPSGSSIWLIFDHTRNLRS
jgi:hypothetical protein